MRITGDKEVVRALQVLGRGLPISSVDRAAVQAAEPMTSEVKARARLHRQPITPKGGKHLDQIIGFFRLKESSKNHRRFVLGATGKRKSILTWLEFGTAPHWQPRRFGGIMHPGARPFPVMRPAYDAHGDKTVERFARSIWIEIERLIRRQGGRRK